MRNRILAAYPDSEFGTTNAPKIYVADFSKRTNKARGVEIHEIMPKDPDNDTSDMDCCVVLEELCRLTTTCSKTINSKTKTMMT